MPSQFAADVNILSPNDSGPRDPHNCQLIVVHTNEGPADGSVEGLLNYLARPETQASYTMVVGGDGRTGRSNDDNYVPWAAGSPANERGLHLCFLGYSRQSRAEWLSRPAQLDAGARVLRDWHDRYGIPLAKLSGAQMRAGQRGVGGHADTVDAWHATDHTDPGGGFPWDVLLAKANGSTATPQPKDGPMALLEETLTNYRGETVTVGTLLKYVDQHVGQTLDQLGGADTSAGADWPGWPQLGGRTVVEALAAIGAKLGIDGFQAGAQ